MFLSYAAFVKYILPERWAPVGEAVCTRCTVVEAGDGAFLQRS